MAFGCALVTQSFDLPVGYGFHGNARREIRNPRNKIYDHVVFALFCPRCLSPVGHLAFQLFDSIDLVSRRYTS